MEKTGKRFFSLCLALLLLAAFPVLASANAAEPPCFTVLVSNAPKGLKLSVQYPDGRNYGPVYLCEDDSRGWESYYRFFRSHGFSEADLGKAQLVVELPEKCFSCPFPEGAVQKYNALFVLDIGSKALKPGTSLFRTPVLVGLRILLTLLIEGLVFFAFGYRSKSSWQAFVIVNLITQVGLNLLFLGESSVNGSYSNTIMLLFYAFAEVLIFMVEAVLFGLLLKEHSDRRAFLYALAGNSASLLAGGACILLLPF